MPLAASLPFLGLARPVSTVRLPNGCTFRYVSRDDVRFLYKEIYVERGYLRHGIQLQQGNTVIDVGANIGLFSAFAAEQVGPEGVVLAAEPLPETFAALAANLESHRQWCLENGVQRSSRVTSLNVGIGDGSSPTATFTLYERAAGWGTMKPDEEEVFQDMGIFLRNALATDRPSDQPSALSLPAQLLGAALLRWAPPAAFEFVWRWAVARKLGRRVQHECQLCTVSDLIQEHGLPRVDLLKIDVERAELDVLRGVAPAHWPLIRQVVVEVHGTNLEAAVALLQQEGGFQRVVAEQEIDLRGSSLHLLYCTREL